MEPRGARFRLVDARGNVHDELVELGRFALVEGKKNLLQYEVSKPSGGDKWRTAVRLDGSETSSAVFDADLGVTTTDNVSAVSMRAEDVLAVHEMGHGPLPAEPRYADGLLAWARQKHSVGG